jgi:hypothetical protein
MKTTDNLKKEIEQIKGQRHQLLIISANEVNRSNTIHSLKQLNIPIKNLNLILSQELRNHPVNKRPREVSTILRKTINEIGDEVICFDRIEYLFNPELQQDPLRLLENLSGNNVLVILWPEDIQDSSLTYATPEHPEFYQKHGYKENIIRV